MAVACHSFRIGPGKSSRSPGVVAYQPMPTVLSSVQVSPSSLLTYMCIWGYLGTATTNREPWELSYSRYHCSAWQWNLTIVR